MGGKKGKGHQGTCIKDPWTKPKWGRIEGGRWEVEVGGVEVGGVGETGGRKTETTVFKQ